METEKVAIYGAGGHGRVVADIVLALGMEPIFVDDGAKGYPDFDTFFATYGTGIPVALGIGENRLRRQAALRVTRAGCSLATLVHPTATVSPSAKLEAGTVVMPGVIVNAGAQVEEGVILNSGCIVEHDCRIGAYVHLSPRVALGGNVSVGTGSHLGIGAAVIHGVGIGEKVIIGAGAVVIRPLPDGVTAVGVPAAVIGVSHG